MTATMNRKGAGTTPAPAPAEYKIPIDGWVARIEGPHGRFGLDRDFLRGTTNKKAGTETHTLRPGWYEYQPPKAGGPGGNIKQPRELIAVDSAGRIIELGPTPTDRDQLRALGKAARRGETIDQPGAYAAAACWCGAEAIKPDPQHGKHQGRARCADHYPPPPGEPPAGAVYDPEPDYATEPPPDTVPAEWLEEWHREETHA